MNSHIRGLPLTVFVGEKYDDKMQDRNTRTSCVQICTTANQRNKWSVQQKDPRSHYLRSRSKFQWRYVKRCGHDPSMHPVPCVPAILARVDFCAACSSDVRVQTFPRKPGSTIAVCGTGVSGTAHAFGHEKNSYIPTKSRSTYGFRIPFCKATAFVCRF